MASNTSIHADDIIIVGAGVVGSALAYTLANDGRRVHVIERDLTEPNRMVGELLQPAGYLKLMELDLQDCLDGIDAQKVFGYAIYKDGASIKLSYPLENFHPDVTARSFHHGRFVQKMREKAASVPNVRLEQGSVTMLIEENGIVKGVEYKTNEGQLRQAYAPLTIVCDGGSSNLRRTLCNSKIEVPSSFVGIVLDKFELPYQNHGHVIIAEPSPVLLFPLSSTEVRCLVDIPGQKLPSISNGEMSSYLRTVIAPQMPAELYDAFISAADKGSFRTMKTRSMAASPNPTPGAFILGDALNMRHPLTGGGMTVALSDVVLLRDLLRTLGNLDDAKSACTSLQSFYMSRKAMASTINTMADSFYKVFSVSDDQGLTKEMRQVCFDYVRVRGNGPDGIIALLSGLNPRPLSVVTQFVSIAVYGVSALLLPYPSPKRISTAAIFIQKALSIIFPIMKAEGFRHMLFPVTMPAFFKVKASD
ncbi:squalene epoxidase 2 [Euphorbia peplus]|nr:squalene epoxidase 2 [Euphorbia peplus]